MKRTLFFIILIVAMLAVGSAGALDFTVRVIPEVTVPFDADIVDGTPTYTIGGGGTLTADVELFNFLAPFLEAGYHGMALNGSTDLNSLMHLFNGGMGVSLFAYPISRLRLGIGAGGGLFFGMQGNTYEQNALLYWSARAEAGYRFSPGFSLSATGSYAQYLLKNGTYFHNGLSFGLNANINPWSLLSESSAALTVEASQKRPVYPIIYPQYNRKSFGTVGITNTESAEIQDVIVTFQMGEYTSQSAVCRKIALIPKGGSVNDIPLLATFGEKVLTLNALTKVPGNLEITYKLLDTPRTYRQSMTIGLNGVNDLTWEDPKILAAFTSPNDPAVIKHSKLVVGLIRDRKRAGIDSNLQDGMGLFEGLRLSEIKYVVDPINPYAAYHVLKEDLKTSDSVAFPYEVFTRGQGDCDELAILYAALLESVGVRAAFIPMGDDFCVAFPLLMEEAEARTTFIDPTSLIYKDGTPWVPVQMSQIREGFLAAWQGGAKKYNAAAGAGTGPLFFTLEEGWKTFQPISLTVDEFTQRQPADEQVKLAFENAVTRFITREIGPKIRKALSDMGSSGGTVKQQNTLGVLYARYGMISEAKTWFEKAAARNSIPALSNLGNIAHLEKNYEDAVRYFGQVLRLQPDNKAAILGLARAMYELDDFAQSDVLFARVQQLDAPLANKYAYLSSKIEGSASRASAVTDRNRMMWNEDSE